MNDWDINPDSYQKDEEGSYALHRDTLICRCVKEVKKQFPELMIICDVALDPYTTHGHDGLIRNNYVLNDKTIEILIKFS